MLKGGNTFDYRNDFWWDYTAFKIESNLEEGSLGEEIDPPIVDEEKVPTVIWQGVGNVHGVNKLKTGPRLNVCDGLTIVYGENGSGKSGYSDDGPYQFLQKKKAEQP